MDRFKPLRSSPPYKPSKIPVEVSFSEVSSVEEPLADELRNLTPDDVELLDSVVLRAGPSANTFLTVFKAYSEVLTERGLDPHEVVYYSKLLKLGTMKGKNWGEKWARVKGQWEKTKMSKPVSKPNGLKHHGPVVSFEDDTVTEFSTFSYQPTSKGSRITNITLDDETPKKPSRSENPPHPRLSTASGHPQTSTPPRRGGTNPSHRKRVVSPASIRKEEMARDIIARAKERKGKGVASVDHTEAWKNIQMQHDEKNADLFRQDRLVERCWQIWRQGYHWIVTTSAQIGEARDQLIVQRALEKWMAKYKSHRELYQHINDLSNRRVLLTFMRLWQARAVECQQKKWRIDMRNRMRIVRQNHESRLIKDVWCRWRAATHEKLVHQSYLDRLLMKTYVAWKEKQNTLFHLKAVADSFSQNGGGSLVKSCWRKWKSVIQYRSAEVTMRNRVDLRIMDGALTKWRQQLHTLATAEAFHEHQLKRRVLKRWVRRVAHVYRLEKRADKHLAKSDGMLLYAVMRIWRAHRNGRLLEQARSNQLKTMALSRWKQAIASHRAAGERADNFLMRPGSSVSITALNLWKQAYIQMKSREELANAFHMSHLALVSIHEWRTKLRKKVKMIKAARAASQYFLMRRAWLQWIEQVEARRREEVLRLHLLNLKKRRFEAWLEKARLQQVRRQAVEDMQKRISQRILHQALAIWTDQVIALKSRELDIIQNCNMVTLVTAFQKWRTKREQHVEAQNLLESFMYLQQKDLLRRSFYRWLSAARVSHHRKVVLQEKEDEMRLRMLEGAWDKWREKALRRREDEILLQRQRNILCRVFARWHGKSKRPIAIRLDRLRVKKEFLKKWKGAMSHTHRIKEAINLDRSFVTGRFFERWLEAYKTQKTIKAVARARHLRLPAAPVRKSIAPSPSASPSNIFPRRSDFLRPQASKKPVEEEDDDSETGSIASVVPPSRALSVKSATSSTYISHKSLAPSVMSSASRFAFSNARPRETSPNRTVQLPSSISRARSDTRSPGPSLRRQERSPSPSAASVKSAGPPLVRRAWPGLQGRSRAFLQPPK